MNLPSDVINPNPIMKKNSKLHSFFRSSSFLKLMILLLFVWSGFFAYWFSIHQNEHRNRLNGFVEQSIETKKSAPSGDELITREKIDELLKPSALILEELGSWDKWMTFWIHIGLGVHMFLVLIIVILLCTHFVPRSSLTSLSESADKRKKIPERFTALITFMGFALPMILSNKYLSGSWQMELKYVMHRMEIFWWYPYGETYKAWTLFFSSLWHNTLALGFDNSFGAGFIGCIVFLQILVGVYLCLPLLFKLEPEDIIPGDKPLPLERVLRFREVKNEKI